MIGHSNRGNNYHRGGDDENGLWFFQSTLLLSVSLKINSPDSPRTNIFQVIGRIADFNAFVYFFAVKSKNENALLG